VAEATFLYSWWVKKTDNDARRHGVLAVGEQFTCEKRTCRLGEVRRYVKLQPNDGKQGSGLYSYIGDPPLKSGSGVTGVQDGTSLRVQTIDGKSVPEGKTFQFIDPSAVVTLGASKK